MDPNITLQMLVEYCQDGDWDMAYETAQDLRTWLSKGGFNPDLTQANLEACMDALFHAVEAAQ